jgi:hypothetical protein
MLGARLAPGWESRYRIGILERGELDAERGQQRAKAALA